MISVLTFMVPMIVKNTRLSFLSTAFMTMLLSSNVVIQFHMVLGETSPLSRYTTATMSSFSSAIPQHKAVAWVGLPKSRARRQKAPRPWIVRHRPIAKQSPSSLFTESVDDCDASIVVPNRRSFLGSLAASAIASQLASVNLAYAAENNATDTVDWGSFGSQLQTPQFTPSSVPGFPAGGSGGSDLENALKDSSKRRNIDPRTHG